MRACRVAGLRPRSGSRTARRGRTRVTYRATGRYRAPPGPGKGRGARRRRPHGGRLLAVSSSRRLYVAVHDHVEYARTECGDAPRRYRGILRVTAGYELRPASATRTSGSASNIHIDPRRHSRPAPARRAPRHTQLAQQGPYRRPISHPRRTAGNPVPQLTAAHLLARHATGLPPGLGARPTCAPFPRRFPSHVSPPPPGPPPPPCPTYAHLLTLDQRGQLHAPLRHMHPIHVGCSPYMHVYMSVYSWPPATCIRLG